MRRGIPGQRVVHLQGAGGAGGHSFYFNYHAAPARASALMNALAGDISKTCPEPIDVRPEDFVSAHTHLGLLRQDVARP
jgi:hypothetical protein